MSQFADNLLNNLVEDHNTNRQIKLLEQRINVLNQEITNTFDNVPNSLLESFTELASKIKTFFSTYDEMRPVTEKNVRFSPATKEAINVYNEEVKKYEQSLKERDNKITTYLLSHTECVQTIRDYILKHCQRFNYTITNLGEQSCRHEFDIGDGKMYCSLVSTCGTWIEIRDGKYFNTYMDNKIHVEVFEIGEDGTETSLNLTIPNIDALFR